MGEVPGGEQVDITVLWVGKSAIKRSCAIAVASATPAFLANAKNKEREKPYNETTLYTARALHVAGAGSYV